MGFCLQALEGELSSCGTGASLPLSMWDLPEPGIKPVTPALAGKFVTTEPPGKSLPSLNSSILNLFWEIMLSLFS